MSAAVIETEVGRLDPERPAAKKVRKKVDPLRPVLAVWCTLVLIFLFIPIGLVILHSFNRGNSFEIWSNHVSTKWWGTLFSTHKAWPAVLKILVVTLIGFALPMLIRVTTGWKNAFVSRWLGPFVFIVVVLVIGHSTDWYRDVFHNPAIGDSLRNSFTAAIGATTVAVVIGGLSGVGLARRPGWWTKPFLLVVFLILVTPEIMDAIALAGWFHRVPLISDWFTTKQLLRAPRGMLALWVGESLYASAVVTLIVRARLAGIDESLEEAAGDLGATPGRAFRQITLPLISSALVAGGLLSFTICLDNTIIAEQVSGPGSSTFPVAVISQLRGTVRPTVGVAAVVLFAVTIGALAFVGVVLKRSGDSSSQIAATLAGG